MQVCFSLTLDSNLLISLVVSARCSYVGVGGGTLQGGLGWLSSEYGLASDPQSMLMRR